MGKQKSSKGRWGRRDKCLKKHANGKEMKDEITKGASAASSDKKIGARGAAKKEGKEKRGRR